MTRGSSNRCGVSIALAAMLAGLAGGCSSMVDMAGIARPGHQPDGSYVLLASEQALACRPLVDEIELSLKDMTKAHGRIETERQELPATMQAVYGRIFGGADGGLKSVAQYRMAESRARALDRQLVAKGCPAFPIDQRIAAMAAPPQAPDAVVAANSGAKPRP